jgi:hypothetical protein
VLSEVSLAVGTANGSRLEQFIGTMARESRMDKMSAEKKNSRVSPCFLHLKILKRAFWAT